MSLTDLGESFRRDKALFIENAGLFIFTAALPFSVSLIQGGIFLFIAAALYRRRKDNSGGLCAGIRTNPLFIPWLAYLAAGALATAFSIAPSVSLHGFSSDLLKVLTFFSLCLFLAPRARDIALKVYLASLAAAAALGIVQALVGLACGADIRAHATSHPVRFGEIMAIGLALALTRLPNPQKFLPHTKKVLYSLIFLIVSAIVLSQTRGAYLGMALLFITLLALRTPPRRTVLTLIAASLLLGLAISTIDARIKNNIASSFKNDNSLVAISIRTRLDLWKTGFKMIKGRPFLGAGPGGVKNLYPVYHTKPYPEDTVWGSLHNLYIQQTAERGFVGLAALLFLFGAMLCVCVRNFRSSPSRSTIWALAVMPSWFLMNVTETSFEHVHTSYAVILALAVSIASLKPE